MPPSKPNILLITADQQRYDATGMTGPSFLRTPHFDNISREGVTFSRAYSDCPLCVPARVSIMTGKQVFTHGEYRNGDTTKRIDRDQSLPGCLRSLGYQTAAIGKMHFTPQRARHGFDEMILPADYYRQMQSSGLPYQPMRHGLGQNELYAGMATVPESLTLTSWIAEQCVNYILDRRDPTVPFFLWCSFSKPHPPLDPPEPYYSMYRNCPIPDPIHGDWSRDENCPEPVKRFRQQWSQDLIPPEIIREARSAYYGLITQNDYNMGRVFAALQDLDMLKDTLIVYTSDHGDFLGDHHCGCKFFFHEPSAHVPFVVRPPKSWGYDLHGTTNAAPVTHADILPTLVKAAGGEPPAGLDGIDLIAAARGQAQPRRYLEAGQEIPGVAYAALTDGRWKYIYYPEGHREQLFDIDNDPGELHDLAGAAEQTADHAAELTRLREELIRRNVARKSPLVKDGRLVELPIRQESERERRSGNWPGFHTDSFQADIRH